MTDKFEGTHLAWRVEKRTKAEAYLASPFALTFGVLFAILGGLTLVGSPEAGLVLLLFTLPCLVAAVGTRTVPYLPPPMPGGHEGHKLADELLRASPNELERRHVFLGWIRGTMRGIPALIDIALLKMHVHVLGPTGFAKTFKVLVPICCQLLRRGIFTVIYLDLKGAMLGLGNAVFFILYTAAWAAGIPVYSFSLNELEAGRIIKMLSDPAFLRLPWHRQARILAESLGVEHGEDFSKGYYGGVGGKLLRNLLKVFAVQKRTLSFARLCAFLGDKSARKAVGMSRRDFDNASNAPNLLEAVSTDARLNTTGEEPINPELFQNAIEIDKVIREPGLFYLKLGAGVDAQQARLIARFLIYLIFQALQNWRGPKVDHIFVAIDECQEMLQRSMLTLIAQSRSFGLSFLLGHQNVSDLKRDGPDFTDAVVNNCAVRITLGARDKEGRERLIKTSGLKTVTLRGTSVTVTRTPDGESRSEGSQTHEVQVPRIDDDLLNEVNGDPELAIVEASPRSGFTDFVGPTLVEIPFSEAPDYFAALNRLPWPPPDGVETVLPGDIPDGPPPPPAQPAPAPRPPQPGPKPSGKRHRKAKPIDPEQRRRADELAERMRRMCRP